MFAASDIENFDFYLKFFPACQLLTKGVLNIIRTDGIMTCLDLVVIARLHPLVTAEEEKKRNEEEMNIKMTNDK